MANAVIERLRQLHKREATPADFEEFHRQTHGETNHRGAAILIAANLELGLDLALHRLITRGRSKWVFGQEKPLGTFRNKIYIAYSFGLLGDETFNALEVIRVIRNLFAHCQSPITFDIPEVLDACALLPLPAYRPPFTAGANDKDVSGLIGRDRYEECCNRIGHNLHVLNFGGVLPIEPKVLGELLPRDYMWVQARQEPLP